MFDFAWSELGLIALVSVLVLGPKQLPETMRTMAKILRRVRSLGAEFQGHVNEMIREAELEELREKVQKFSQTSVASEVTKLVDPTGEIANGLQIAPPAESPSSDAPSSDAPSSEAPPSEAPPAEAASADAASGAHVSAPASEPHAAAPEPSAAQPANDPAVQSRTAAP